MAQALKILEQLTPLDMLGKKVISVNGEIAFVVCVHFPITGAVQFTVTCGRTSRETPASYWRLFKDDSDASNHTE